MVPIKSYMRRVKLFLNWLIRGNSESPGVVDSFRISGCEALISLPISSNTSNDDCLCCFFFSNIPIPNSATRRGDNLPVVGKIRTRRAPSSWRRQLGRGSSFPFGQWLSTKASSCLWIMNNTVYGMNSWSGFDYITCVANPSSSLSFCFVFLLRLDSCSCCLVSVQAVRTIRLNR